MPNIKAKLAFNGSSQAPPRRDVSNSCAMALFDGFNLMIGTTHRLKDHAMPKQHVRWVQFVTLRPIERNIPDTMNNETIMPQCMKGMR